VRWFNVHYRLNSCARRFLPFYLCNMYARSPRMSHVLLLPLLPKALPLTCLSVPPLQGCDWRVPLPLNYRACSIPFKLISPCLHVPTLPKTHGLSCENGGMNST